MKIRRHSSDRSHAGAVSVLVRKAALERLASHRGTAPERTAEGRFRVRIEGRDERTVLLGPALR